MSGYSQCSLKDLTVNQFPTRNKVQGKQEWSVTINNKCPCVQKNVILNCKGFQSVESIKPSLLKVLHNICLVNSGQAIYGIPIKFRYASDQPFPLNPISSEISCS